MGTGQRVQQNWAEVLAAQAASGEAVPGFCRRRGIRPELFYRWLNQLLGS